jgi:hypothetical protein
MNLNQNIKNLRGQNVKLSFPSQEEIDKLPKTADGKPDASKLPDDTFRNVILTCLSLYKIRDRREIFLVQPLGETILSFEGDFVPTEAQQKFLVKVLSDQTIREKEDGTTDGIYMSWVISQLLSELGEN